MRDVNTTDDTSLKSFCEGLELPDELTSSIWEGIEAFVWSKKHVTTDTENDNKDMTNEAINTLEMYINAGFEKNLVIQFTKKGKEKALVQFFDRVDLKATRDDERAMRAGAEAALRTAFESWMDGVTSKKKATKMLKKTKLLKETKTK